jgi:hypothetical protein
VKNKGWDVAQRYSASSTRQALGSISSTKGGREGTLSKGEREGENKASKPNTSTKDYNPSEPQTKIHRITYYTRCILSKIWPFKTQLFNLISSEKLF